MYKSLFVILILLVQFLGVSYAQINIGGQPESFKSKTVSKIFHEVYVPVPDFAKIILEDEESNNERFAVLVPVDYSTNNSGTWEWMADGSRIWRLKITLETSLAISLYFRDFQLSEGVELFLYDEDKKQIKGAFTQHNNTQNGLFATELISGDQVILELYVPSEINDVSFFTISEVSYAYRYINEENTKGSGYCEVNTNCSPEGDDWQKEKLGVVRIKVKISGALFWCSGSLINNVREDKTPYILTADHCAFKFSNYATPDELSQWIFDFNYEGLDCSSENPQTGNFTLVGAEKVAHGGSQGDDGSDFYLLKLLDSIPESNNVVFNGWSAEGADSDYGVTIHHPNGDIKKISTYTSSLVTTSWQGNGLPSHWEVVWTQTINGWGVTEGGSSGSPVFDEYGRIIGTLTGGLASCSNKEAPDYYGKFSFHWSSNGTEDTLQLKPWLDPDNTGVTSMGGTDVDTSTQEKPENPSVEIEINPVFDNWLTFKFDHSDSKEAHITIVDLSGRIILTRDVEFDVNTYVLDISRLPNGFYVSSIIYDSNTIGKKFIKQ